MRTTGSVIVRLRPGTAKGLLVITLEDETGMSQAMATPQLLRENREVITGSSGWIVEGLSCRLSPFDVLERPVLFSGVSRCRSSLCYVKFHIAGGTRHG